MKVKTKKGDSCRYLSCLQDPMQNWKNDWEFQGSRTSTAAGTMWDRQAALVGIFLTM